MISRKRIAKLGLEIQKLFARRDRASMHLTHHPAPATHRGSGKQLAEKAG